MLPFCKAILTGAFALTPNVANLQSTDIVRLKCSTPIGPNQEITVFQRGEKFFLIETPNQGSGTPLPEREITEEWLNGEGVTLRDDGSFSETKLWSAGDDAWMLETNGPGTFEQAPADCD